MQVVEIIRVFLKYILGCLFLNSINMLLLILYYNLLLII